MPGEECISIIAHVLNVYSCGRNHLALIKSEDSIKLNVIVAMNTH